jgi:hypothetical protein
MIPRLDSFALGQSIPTRFMGSAPAIDTAN